MGVRGWAGGGLEGGGGEEMGGSASVPVSDGEVPTRRFPTRCHCEKRRAVLNPHTLSVTQHLVVLTLTMTVVCDGENTDLYSPTATVITRMFM